MKTFLVPTDFSDSSLRALDYACDLAKEVGAKVIVCHIYDQSALPSFVIAREKAHNEECQQKMSNFLAKSQCEGAMTEPVIKGGNVVEEIVDAIDELGVSLVVMATAGEKSLKERFFGTRTEAIAKRGLCSVLVLPESGTIKPIEHIVYAADFENGDQVTVLQLMQLKELFNSTLTFLHIKSKSQPDLINDEYVKEELIKQFPQADIQFVEIANENVAEGISRFVHETNTSLLSFTMLNRIFLERMTHNSVSAKLLRNLNLPMLALPENGRLLDLQRPANSD
ncbi:universal stress protein [Pontibacter locisalis]|uniref:Universal stress protein n=1 Tax=Pontibacter locisalis TaxID=1719035 RepID=A0ABW5IG83_9BACT